MYVCCHMCISTMYIDNLNFVCIQTVVLDSHVPCLTPEQFSDSHLTRCNAEKLVPNGGHPEKPRNLPIPEPSQKGYRHPTKCPGKRKSRVTRARAQ